jgi:hypothetical protein
MMTMTTIGVLPDRMENAVEKFVRGALVGLVVDLCDEAGIPDELVSAVIHRAMLGCTAKSTIEGFTPLAGSGPTIVLVSSLEGIEEEIDSSLRAVCRRVVEKSVRDHQAGVLERRV